jgi:hypothetical protein
MLMINHARTYMIGMERKVLRVTSTKAKMRQRDMICVW